MNILSSRYVKVYSIIIVVWFITHIFSIGWGLPNLSSFAPDAIPPNVSYSAKEALLAGGNKYPPLQYLINSAFLKQHNENDKKNINTIINLRTERIVTMNWVTALMQLMSAIAIAVIVAITMNFPVGSLVAGLLYLLNGVSFYYSNTSNMDVPYSMWILFSILALILAHKSRDSKRFIAYNITFALFTSFAFCTKDQAYASYIIPILALIIWQYYKFRKVSLIIIECAIWIVVFVLSLLLIYSVVGGFHVFWSHLNWITNDGIRDYKQISSSLTGKAQLVLISLKDICQMLDYPLIGLMILSAVFLYLYYVRKKEDLEFLRTAKIAFVICLLAYVSIIVFFVEIVQFSYARFYLPLLPFFCYFLAWSFINFKNYLVFRFIFILLLVLQFFISVQLIFELRYNSRVSLKSFYLNEAEHKRKYIACDGVTIGIGIRTAYGRSGDKQYIALRDWSGSTFGYLPNCKSINVNPFSIAMLFPDIIISTNAHDDTLLSNSYNVTETIKGYPSHLPSLYHFATPVFYIYEKQPGAKVSMSQLNKFMDNTKFEIVMLYISNIINPAIIDYQITLMSEVVPKFRVPDLSEYLIYPNAFAFLIQSYGKAQKFDELSKIYKFLLATNLKDMFEADAEKFFKTYSSTPIRN